MTPRNGGHTGGLTTELSGVVVARLGISSGAGPATLPAHVAPTLRAHTSARPLRRAAALLPRPDPRARQRVDAAGVTPYDLRLRGDVSEPYVARATERLLAAFADHLRSDLHVPAGRVEAMVQAVGYLLWFSRRHAGLSPLRLDAATARACFGNHYIRRQPRPELTWIHYGLRGTATFAAFLVRLGWLDTDRVAELLALPGAAPWYSDRLKSYWSTGGAALAEWVSVDDYGGRR